MPFKETLGWDRDRSSTTPNIRTTQDICRGDGSTLLKKYFMITFEKIRWKNFCLQGMDIEIEFNRSPTTLVVGENGSGKSTMLDVCFVIQ